MLDPRPSPAAEKSIDAVDAARDIFVHEIAVMFRRDQAGIKHEPAALDDEVVIAAPISGAADFFHEETPPFRAVIGGSVIEQDHAVCESLDMRIALGRARVIDQERGAVAIGEVLL